MDEVWTTAEKAAYSQGRADARLGIALRIEKERDDMLGDRITGAAPMIRAALTNAARIARHFR